MDTIFTTTVPAAAATPLPAIPSAALLIFDLEAALTVRLLAEIGASCASSPQTRALTLLPMRLTPTVPDTAALPLALTASMMLLMVEVSSALTVMSLEPPVLTTLERVNSANVVLLIKFAPSTTPTAALPDPAIFTIAALMVELLVASTIKSSVSARLEFRPVFVAGSAAPTRAAVVEPT